MSRWDYFPEYVPVAEKKARAAKKLKELSRKNPKIKPVILEGTAIARTWWGKAWNLNLERYADYHNRMGRGRSYVRNGAVLDLQIDPGEVRALVQGSRSKPYEVAININGLKKSVWRAILDQCQGMLESLQELLGGSFPKAIGEIFTYKGSGMFPSPTEIKFSCSCPDWAGMCKHVAAALYGIGARLDESPELFFRMRNVEMGDLICEAVSGHKKKLLARASRKSSRIIEGADLSATFGIELEPDPVAGPSASSADAPSVSGGKGKRAASPGKRTSPSGKPRPKRSPTSPDGRRKKGGPPKK